MKVVIVGAGTSAITVADILVQDKNFKLSGFLGTDEEEAKYMGKKLYNDVQFIGNHSMLKKLRENDIVGFVAAMENNYHREKAYYEAVQAGLVPINVISRYAIIEPSVIMGKGVVINAGCIISHGVSIENNTYIGSGVIIEINTKIGENCHIASACVISGACNIRRNVTFQMRATIGSYVTVGKNQTIKEGCIIKKSLPDLPLERFEE